MRGRYNPVMTIHSTPLVKLRLRDLDDTTAVASIIAPHLQTTDIVALDGDLGAGKTTLARALINAMPGATEDVPSPTFTLVQTYTRGALDIWHFDLYRLEDPDEVWELGIDDAFSDGVSLIEWPDKLGPYLPKRRLLVTMAPDSDGMARHMTLTGDNTWAKRLSICDWRGLNV